MKSWAQLVYLFILLLINFVLSWCHNLVSFGWKKLSSSIQRILVYINKSCANPLERLDLFEQKGQIFLSVFVIKVFGNKLVLFKKWYLCDKHSDFIAIVSCHWSLEIIHRVATVLVRLRWVNLVYTGLYELARLDRSCPLIGYQEGYLGLSWSQVVSGSQQHCYAPIMCFV